MTVPEITVTEIAADAVLVDVREPDEWQAGHADGALHLPMAEVPGRIADLPADTRLSIICRVGGRSAQVTAYLTQAGYDAVNVTGGMQAWAAAGRPMVSEDGAPPRVI